ncbi:hypothetical protein ACFVVM_14120 [Nocardia sp. NPDC058176]|uniref:hypothetical protein n=1 Tax=Nocardia sp. NPDC058176 TaxID=3346368 RepID=UPI0036DB2391
MNSVPADVDILADHPLILAVPAFAPALVVVGIIVFIAVRDRRAEKRESEEGSVAPESALDEENP